MAEEIVNYLKLKPGQVIVDATIGTGGHSARILESILPGGRVIGIDRDEESLEVCRARLAGAKDALILVHGNFSSLDTILDSLGVKKADGIIFDLGISSYQLEDSQRGFSFRGDGPLDMRMDRSSYISAYDLVNNLNEEEISTILWNFGQERWHNRIARLLVEERQRQPISTTAQLANIVERSLPARYRNRFFRIHPATRTFQAMRIAVNRELEILEAALAKAIGCLGRGARICVISFHSLEDRAAKLSFRRAHSRGLVEIITPKPLEPRGPEVAANPRCRSSKLRVAERL